MTMFVNGTYSASQIVNFALKTQTITFPPIGNQTVGAPPIILSATTSSPLRVTYTAVGPVRIVGGGVLVFVGPGTATVAARQEGNVDFAAAKGVRQTFTISP